jgi:hypothetical protein
MTLCLPNQLHFGKYPGLARGARVFFVSPTHRLDESKAAAETFDSIEQLGHRSHEPASRIREILEIARKTPIKEYNYWSNYTDATLPRVAGP